MKGNFNTPYTHDTFDDFPFSGLSEERKDELLTGINDATDGLRL